MRRLLLLLAVVLVAAVGSCQEYVPSPQTVEWDAPTTGFADRYEVGVQRNGTGEIQIIATTALPEMLVDLEALGLYGRYVVLVRSIAETEPDLVDVSDWARSDNPDDVILIDGEAVTFLIGRGRVAGVPAMLRVR